MVLRRAGGRHPTDKGGPRGCSSPKLTHYPRTDLHAAKLAEGEKGETSVKVAAYVGMSGRTLEKAKAVVEATEAHPQSRW